MRVMWTRMTLADPHGEGGRGGDWTLTAHQPHTEALERANKAPRTGESLYIPLQIDTRH